jgi:hypothetical protein
MDEPVDHRRGDDVVAEPFRDFARLAFKFNRLLEVVEQVRRFERKELSILGVFATQARRTLHSRETLELLGDLSVAV